MSLFNQTRIAAQERYLRNLTDLTHMQASIEAQETLINILNQYTGITASADFSGYLIGAPAVDIQISHGGIENIAHINQMIEFYGWQAPVPHANNNKTHLTQIWSAPGNTLEINDGNSINRFEREAFRITYRFAATQALPQTQIALEQDGQNT